MPIGWTTSYKGLPSRQKTKVRIEGLSTWGNLGQGVPRGSILRPPVFIPYVDNFSNNLNEGTLNDFANDDTISSLQLTWMIYFG